MNKIKPHHIFSVGGQYKVVHLGPKYGLSKYIAVQTIIPDGWISHPISEIQTIEDARFLDAIDNYITKLEEEEESNG